MLSAVAALPETTRSAPGCHREPRRAPGSHCEPRSALGCHREAQHPCGFWFVLMHLRPPPADVRIGRERGHEKPFDSPPELRVSLRVLRVFSPSQQWSLRLAGRAAARTVAAGCVGSRWPARPRGRSGSGSPRQPPLPSTVSVAGEESAESACFSPLGALVPGAHLRTPPPPCPPVPLSPASFALREAEGAGPAPRCRWTPGASRRWRRVVRMKQPQGRKAGCGAGRGAHSTFTRPGPVTAPLSVGNPGVSQARAGGNGAASSGVERPAEGMRVTPSGGSWIR